VISSVVVSYQVRPEAVAEHVRLIEAVFAARVATPPVPTAADIIGSYYPAVPVTDR
jgi:hypothetical protein